MNSEILDILASERPWVRDAVVCLSVPRSFTMELAEASLTEAVGLNGKTHALIGVLTDVGLLRERGGSFYLGDVLRSEARAAEPKKLSKFANWWSASIDSERSQSSRADALYVQATAGSRSAFDELQRNIAQGIKERQWGSAHNQLSLVAELECLPREYLSWQLRDTALLGLSAYRERLWTVAVTRLADVARAYFAEREYFAELSEALHLLGVLCSRRQGGDGLYIDVPWSPVQLFEASLEVDERMDFDEHRAIVLNSLARRLSQYNQDHPRAVECVREAIGISQSFDNAEVEAYSRANLAVCLSNGGYASEEVTKAFTEAIEAAKSSGALETEAFASAAYARFLRIRPETRSLAISYLEIASDLYRKIGDWSNRNRQLRMLARLLTDQAERMLGSDDSHAAVVGYLRRAIGLFDALGEPRALTYTYGLLGNALSEQGEHLEEAMQLYFQAISINYANGPDRYLAASLINGGKFLRSHGFALSPDTREAAKILRGNGNLHDDTERALALSARANYLARTSNDIRAIQMAYQDALEASESLHDKSLLADSLAGLANWLAHSVKDTNRIESTFRHAIGVAERLEDKASLTCIVTNWANYLARSSNDANAVVSAYDDAIAIAEGLDDKLQLAYCLGASAAYLDCMSREKQAQSRRRELLNATESLGGVLELVKRLLNLADFDQRQDLVQYGRCLHQEAIAISRLCGDESAHAYALGHWANYLANTSKDGDAVQGAYHAALDVAGRLPERYQVAYVRAGLANWLASGAKDPQYVEEAFRKAIDAAEQLDDKGQLAYVLTRWATYLGRRRLGPNDAILSRQSYFRALKIQWRPTSAEAAASIAFRWSKALATKRVMVKIGLEDIDMENEPDEPDSSLTLSLETDVPPETRQF